MGGCRPEGHSTDFSNKRTEEASRNREELRRLLKEARAQKGLLCRRWKIELEEVSGKRKVTRTHSVSHS
jgi:hypothetical protein